VVEEYLEEAAIRGMRQVRIIHGRGTGVQRRMVRQALSRHPRVEAYGNAPAESGGWGATLVVLRLS
jgi:dsDNA-specific endonuclease/ATPase MutS2